MGGKKKIKNAILGNVSNVGSINIGDRISYHISRDKSEESKIMFKDIKDKDQMAEGNGEVFIMYSWDSEPHKEKVLSLWKTLREQGFNAVIDRQVSQENSAADFNTMMHKAITDDNKVIIVLSEGYKERANNFKGGVGFEYNMVIKDINDKHKKYILISFDSINDSIFPAFLKGREVIPILEEADLEKLYRKLLDVPEIEIPEVAKTTPILLPKSVPTLFKTEGIQIISVNPKSKEGSHQDGLYITHVQAISISLKNASTKIIDNCKIKVEIPKAFVEYNPNAELNNGNVVFSTICQQKFYQDETIEIDCGHTCINYKDKEEAFNSYIKVTVLSEFGKSQFSQPISGFLFGSDIFNNVKQLSLSDFL